VVGDDPSFSEKVSSAARAKSLLYRPARSKDPVAEGTKMMMNFFSVFSSKAVQPQSARPSESPRNWRCQLGTFWQDIEEAGSVLKARRLVPSEVRVQRTGGIDRAAGRHGD
jgi:hypothetical protein